MLKTKVSFLYPLVVFGLANMIFTGVMPWAILKPICFGILIMVPGFYLSTIFKIKHKEQAIFSLGLGLTYLMVTGLIVNTVLPLFGIYDPLSLAYLLPTIDICTAVLALVSWHTVDWKKKNSKLQLRKILIKNKTKSYLLILLYMLTLISAIAGAIRLNNGASNSVSMGTLLILVILWGAALVFIKDEDRTFPIILYLTGLSILLMFSLRSNYVSGYDIQSELHVFKLTVFQHRWVLGSERDAYNATLSLTILPTIIKEFLHINFDTVFKFYYPLIAAAMGSIVYLFARKFLKPKLAFIVAIFFMAQSQFMQQMPSLDRQEIAFIFFLLFFYLIFIQNTRQLYKNSLLVILGFSIVISHYSTAYVCVMVLTISYILARIFVRFELISSSDFKKLHPSGFMVFILIAMSLFWYGQLSNNAGNLTQALKSAVQNLTHIASQEQKSLAAIEAIGGTPEANAVAVQAYRSHFISPSVANTAHPSLASVDLPQLPSQVPSHGLVLADATSIISYVSQKLLNKVFLVLGVLTCGVSILRRKKSGSEQVVLFALAFAFLILTLAILLLPSLSLYYNFERLYQQALPVLGVLIIIGAVNLIKTLRIKLSYVVPLLFILVVAYFLGYVGFLTEIAGGNPTMQLSNSGYVYDQFYKHDGEVLAVAWISQNRTKNIPLSSDEYGSVQLESVYPPSLKINTNITQAGLSKNDMLFITFTNIYDNIAFAKYQNTTITYTYPGSLIENSKSRIYDNTVSQVYR